MMNKIIAPSGSEQIDGAEQHTIEKAAKTVQWLQSTIMKSLFSKNKSSEFINLHIVDFEAGLILTSPTMGFKEVGLEEPHPEFNTAAISVNRLVPPKSTPEGMEREKMEKVYYVRPLEPMPTESTILTAMTEVGLLRADQEANVIKLLARRGLHEVVKTEEPSTHPELTEELLIDKATHQQLTQDALEFQTGINEVVQAQTTEELPLLGEKLERIEGNLIHAEHIVHDLIKAAHNGAAPQQIEVNAPKSKLNRKRKTLRPPNRA